MDAETACAIWEEANCTYKSQRGILRHLWNFFGCRITVPERYIRELEEGVLDPICGEAEFDGKQVSFWHKSIDDVLLHWLKLELKHGGSSFFSNFTTVDVVFGGDHGAWRFRAVVKIIFRNADRPDVFTHSITLQVGHINCEKDTYEVLKGTIGVQLNDILWQIVNKFAVIHLILNEEPVVVIADESPGSNNNVTLAIRVFILVIWHSTQQF